MRVYLAGKIGKNDWRHELFPGLRDYDYDRIKGTYLEEEREPLVYEGVEYSGPFFISDDRGSFHGEGRHGRGVGLKQSPLDDFSIEKGRKVVRLCFDWIKNAEAVFCWLDSSDAYGTIVELGYAAALNKRIFMGIDKALVGSEFLKDVWFARKTADKVVYTGTVGEAWDIFIGRNEVQNKAVFSYIHNEKSLSLLETKINEFCNQLTRVPGGTRPVEEINEWERHELAAQCVVAMNLRGLLGDVCAGEEFRQDLAREIDFRLVRGFYKNRDMLTNAELKRWRIDGSGLVYRFEENYERERKREEVKAAFQPRITEKQAELVTRLLIKGRKKLNLEVQQLTIEQAGEFISHFLHGEPLTGETAGLLDVLPEEEVPAQFFHAFKASDVVERVGDALAPLGLKFNMPTHTKCCKHYQVQEAENEFCKYESDLKYPSYRYSQKWIDFLIRELSTPERYEEVVKAKK